MALICMFVLVNLFRMYFCKSIIIFFVQLIVCAAFEVVTMGGFRRGIGTRAKTKLATCGNATNEARLGVVSKCML